MRRLRHWLRHHITYRWARRLVVGIIGGTVLLGGFALIVLPGPAVVVIPLGLAILSLEFAWARMWLRRVRNKAQKFSDGVRERWSR
ncbi:MAG: PGPGW domain-containing protein [Steroidobacteraceae bacterium]|nr:PGPGW domain-containing protein [Steroidobacteraceae bacterium]